MVISDECLLRIDVMTLGCKVNQAESQKLMRELAKRGYYCGEGIDRPDISVINTCAVTSVSEAKSRKEIRRAWRRGAKRIIVTGCLAQIKAEAIKGMPQVDLVVPQSGKNDLVALVERMAQEIMGTEELRFPEVPGSVSEGRRARYFIKIQDGCDRRCAYCVIPQARGRSKSIPERKVLQEVRDALDEGAGELVLCGVNLAGYGSPNKERLLGLLEKIENLQGDFRVRLSSMDAEDMDTELLKGMRRLNRICPHFHLPLQSGDNSVLERMGRGYTREDFRRLVDTIRSMWEDPAITLDVMVGFPGEGEREFGNTLSFLEELKPARLHVFRYSPRPGTASFLWADDVPHQEKQERMSKLIGLSSELMRRYSQRQVGCERSVVVEALSFSNCGFEEARGLTENYLKVKVDGGGIRVGGIYRVRIEGMDEGTLKASLVGDK